VKTYTDPCDLLARTLRGRETVAEARSWLLDCFGDDEDAVEAIRLANHVVVVGYVQRHYEGGWVQFAKDGDAWSGLTPRERQLAA